MLYFTKDSLNVGNVAGLLTVVMIFAQLYAAWNYRNYIVSYQA